MVVTATSDNHYAEAQDMVASVQKFLPNTKLIVIGMTAKRKQQLHEYCNVEGRSFQFEKYPQNLKTYAWKTVDHQRSCMYMRSDLLGRFQCKTEGTFIRRENIPH